MKNVSRYSERENRPRVRSGSVIDHDYPVVGEQLSLDSVVFFGLEDREVFDGQAKGKDTG
jgi:hypothetical protein